MGVDKYSDVLDSEVAECDFTDVYMRSISHPSKIADSLYPVEAEMKQQILITPKRRVHDGDHDGNYKVRNSPKDISNRAVSLVKWLPIINHLLAFYISDKSIFAELVSSV